jgi:protein-disulfide isomerase
MGQGSFYRKFNATKTWLMAVCLALGLLLLAGTQPGFAQSSDEIGALKAEIQALKAGQAAIQKNLAVITQFLQQQQQQRSQASPRSQPQPFQPMDLSVAGAPALGEAGAVVTIIEFTDYQCPFCRRHSAQTVPQLVKDYVETGKLRYVMREFPLASIHPQATKAAEAALCAGDQGKYWDMHDAFFANPRKLALKDLKAHAEGFGLDMKDFSECLDDGKYAQRVQKDLADGAKAGVRGTPTFFLGLTDPTDPTKIRATKTLRGAQSYAAFKQIIDALIAQAAKGS